MRPPSVGLITSTTRLKYVEFCVSVKRKKKEKETEKWMDFVGRESKQEK